MPRRRWPRLGLVVAFLALAATWVSAADSTGPTRDLSHAVVVAARDPRTTVAATVLVEEIEKRTGLRLKVTDAAPAGSPAVVLVRDGKGPAEGFEIQVDAGSTVTVLGNDSRGLLFGVGRLLRELDLKKRAIRVRLDLAITAAPATKLRGHQLGYRAKTNSYDAWDLPQWDQYIRELALFGTNAIELVPPRTDDDLDSPHFPRPPLEMMTGMSRICDRYDLDVWVWFPVMDPVDTNPEKTEPLLREWDEVFHALPRINAVFIPGGDPGHIPPAPLFAFLDRAAEVLHRVHPKAEMWVSPQGFTAPVTEEFLTLTRARPKWLTGLVFGPQVRVPLAELRKRIPAEMPIRGYPDITHSRQCQHPVPDWDLAYAVTEGRESINPRPRAEAAIARAYLPDSIGFLSYSEGCNDDVNKFVWSAIGWDPKTDAERVVRDYARLLIGEPFADRFARGLLGLEHNWSGPLDRNAGVEETLRLFTDLERDVPPAVKRNWRFQQALYRAHYDAFLRNRLVDEMDRQALAIATLADFERNHGVDAAITKALDLLDRPIHRSILDQRARVFELGEALFQSIGMQLSKPRYQAIDPERGANLDTIDTPLNDREWLRAQLAGVLANPNAEARGAAVKRLLHRTDPGPGGFYDELGNPDRSPHLVREPSYASDPMFVQAPFHGFALRTDWPVAWRRYAQTFHDAPLRMRYHGLNPRARYRIRVTYSGDSPKGRIQCKANGQEVHPLIVKPNPVRPIEFDIPAGATAQGELTLEWNQEPGRGGNGRGCQVAEVWLMKVENQHD